MTLSPHEELGEALAASLLPTRDPAGHKGTFGRVVVVAGSPEYAGAALMSGAAALRAGCGLVTLCVPASIRPHLLGRVPELILRELPQRGGGELDVDEAAAMVTELEQDALLIGPGLVPDRDTSRLVLALLRADGPACVVDAGALAALAGVDGWWQRVSRERVLTPHVGELAHLGRTVAGDGAARLSAALESAAAWASTVVLKGAGSVIAEADGRARLVPLEVPALASAGTGDVLAGVISSLIGQGLRPFDAASLGVYLHARAGQHVAESLGDAGLMATDLLTAIPRVRRHLDGIRSRATSSRLGFDVPRT